MKDNLLEKKLSRRDFVNRAALTGMAVAMGPLLAACGKGASSTKNQDSQNGAKSGSADKFIRGDIANQTFNLENTYFSIFDNGVKEAAAALGLGTTLLQHNGDANLQLSQVNQRAVNNGKNIITYCPSAGVVPSFTKSCQDNKIYALNVWNTPAWFTPLNVGDYYVQFNEPDGRVMGYETAKLLFEKLGGKGTVIHNPGYPGTSSDAERTAGIKRALKEYPNIKLVVSQPGNWNRIDARKALEALLVSVNSFDGVIGQNDDQAIGLVNVLKDRKINVPVVGMDGTPEALQYVQKGDLFATHSELIGFQGGWNVVQAFDVQNGWKPSVPERMIFTQSILTTKENVDTIYKKLYGGQKTTFDWVKMSRVLNPDNWDPQVEIKPIDVWEFWAGQKVEPGMGLPKEYDEAKGKGEWERVAALYKDHYKMKFI